MGSICQLHWIDLPLLYAFISKFPHLDFNEWEFCCCSCGLDLRRPNYPDYICSCHRIHLSRFKWICMTIALNGPTYALDSPIRITLNDGNSHDESRWMECNLYLPLQWANVAQSGCPPFIVSFPKFILIEFPRHIAFWFFIELNGTEMHARVAHCILCTFVKLCTFSLV